MESDSKMEIDSTLPECEKNEVGVSEDGGNEAKLSAEHKDNMKEAVNSEKQEESKTNEECPEEQVDDMKEAETPVKQNEVGNTHEAVKSAGKCGGVGSSGKKTTKVLVVKRKIVKKSPASGVLKAKKAQGKQDDEKKDKEVPAVQKTPQAGNSAEKSSGMESSGNKTSVVRTVKRRILKKSPASSVLKAEKVQDEDDEKKEKEAPAGQEVIGTSQAENATEKCGKSDLSTKKKVLKVKKKIVKKSATGSLLTPKVQDTPKVQGTPKVQARKRKSVLQANAESGEKKVKDVKKLNQKEDSKISTPKVEHNEKTEEIRASEKETSKLENTLQVQKNVEKGDPSDKSVKNQNNKGPSDKSVKNPKNEDNDNMEQIQEKDTDKEKFGGLIFMCSSKTKPDCFQYQIMGVPAGKKDSVLAIKPGLKLFLYDFELRLLYGIYKASSSGGMKLEPKAFNGAFPAQVRFSIYKDCFPLPESVFKKAIQDNYYERHKFKHELTEKQVRKLSDLFRPVGVPSSSAPRAPIHDKKVHGGVEEVRSRDPKSNGDTRNHHSSSHETDRKVSYRDKAPRRRDEASRDLYLSEKDYRTYGLRAERRNLDPVPHSALETHQKDYDRDYHLRHPERRYMDVVRADHVYFNGKDYPVYSIDSRPELSPPKTISASVSERYAYDPYHTRQYILPHMETHLHPSRREEGQGRPTYSAGNYVIDTEPARRAADALSHYNQMHHKKPETETMPVSSRYSFAGPSYSYR